MTDQTNTQTQPTEQEQEYVLNALRFGIAQLEARRTTRRTLKERGLSIDEISVIVGQQPIEMQFDEINLNLLVQAVEGMAEKDGEPVATATE